MKVSVLTLTYNHEAFIAQAIESVLHQTVNFDYEMIIGEDCSSDNTRDIVLNYQHCYPERIRTWLPDFNQGMMKNLKETLAMCKGEYIAILDGDDYWTSNNKLQIQVEFLDQHPEIAICYHLVEEHNERGEVLSVQPPRKFRAPILAQEDLLFGNFIPTCSIMFRNGLIKELPDWVLSLHAADWPLLLLLSAYGKIGLIQDCMGVYRRHRNNAWISKPLSWRKEASLFTYTVLENEMGSVFRQEIIKIIPIIRIQLAIAYGSERQFSQAFLALREGLRNLFCTKDASFVSIIINSIRRLFQSTSRFLCSR